jgi:hypothetical protein
MRLIQGRALSAQPLRKYGTMPPLLRFRVLAQFLLYVSCCSDYVFW